MKVGIIGAGTMGQGIAKAFASVEGYEVALCDIEQSFAENGLKKIAAGYAKLVAKGKLDQEKVDAILARIKAGVKEDLCADFRHEHLQPFCDGDRQRPLPPADRHAFLQSGGPHEACGSHRR